MSYVYRSFMLIFIILSLFIAQNYVLREFKIVVNSNDLLSKNSSGGEIREVNKANLMKYLPQDLELPEVALERIIDERFTHLRSWSNFLKSGAIVEYEVTLKNNLLFETYQNDQKVSSSKTSIICKTTGEKIDFDQTLNMGSIDFSAESLFRKLRLNGCSIVIPVEKVKFPQGQVKSGLNGEISIIVKPHTNELLLGFISIVEVVALFEFLKSLIRLIKKGLFSIGV